MFPKYQLAFYIFLISLFFSYNGYGQDDSFINLKDQLQKSKRDTSRVQILLELCKKVENSDEQLYYSNRAISLSKELNYPIGVALAEIKQSEAYIDRGEYADALNSLEYSLEYFQSWKEHEGYAKALLNMGRSYDFQNRFDTAFSYYDSAIYYAFQNGHMEILAESHYFRAGLYNAIGENLEAEGSILQAFAHYDSLNSKENLWYVLNVMGVIYDDLGNYPKALNSYMQALEIVEELKEVDGQIMILNNIATFYYQVGKLDESLKYYDLALGQTVGRIEDDANWYLFGNKAQIHAELGDTVGALVNFRKALELSKDLKDECEQVYILEGIGFIMAQKNELDSAKLCFNLAIDLSKKCNNQLVMTTTKRGLGELLVKEGNYKIAERLFKESLTLSEKFQFPKEKEKASFQLYLLSKRRKRNNEALRFFEMYSATKDSLFGKETNMAISRISSEFEFKKELQRMEYSRQADELRMKAELKKEESNKNVLLLVLVLTVLLAATLV